jgi:glutathione S-transferase
MTIAPIVQSVTVAVLPDRAFTLFTGSMGCWWKRGMTIGAKPHEEVVIEPHPGGRWFERDEDGAETDWGKVLAWEPPGRVLLGWQIDATFKHDPDLTTEVEVTFAPPRKGNARDADPPPFGALRRVGRAHRRAARRRLARPAPDVRRPYREGCMMTEFTIHGIPGSPYVRAPLLALEEKGLSWRLEALPMGGNRTREYKASLHPFAKIPVLDHGDFRLYETRAILDYVDQVGSGPSLTPVDSRLRARMNQVIGIVDSYVAQRVSATVTFPRLIAPRFGIPVDDAAVAAALAPAREVVDELARLLGEGDYMAGPAVSLGDLMLIPHLSFLPDFAEGAALIATHANLARWIDRMTVRASMAATEWDVLLDRFPMPLAAEPVAAHQ